MRMVNINITAASTSPSLLVPTAWQKGQSGAGGGPASVPPTSAPAEARAALNSRPRHLPECDSAPTSEWAALPHPHAVGGSGSSAQSHCVSSPRGCSFTATARQSSVGTAHTPAADRGPGSGGSLSDRTARTPTPAARRTTSRPTDEDHQQAAARSSRQTARTGPPHPAGARRPHGRPQIDADGFTVPAQMAGDRGDRPPLPVQRGISC